MDRDLTGANYRSYRETSQSVCRRQTGLRELLESSCGGNAEVDGVCRQASNDAGRPDKPSGGWERETACVKTRRRCQADNTSVQHPAHGTTAVCMPNDGITTGREHRTYLSLDAQCAARRARQRGRRQQLREGAARREAKAGRDRDDARGWAEYAGGQWWLLRRKVRAVVAQKLSREGAQYRYRYTLEVYLEGERIDDRTARDE